MSDKGILCSGFLKQQHIDPITGLYSWSKRFFTLVSSGQLHIQNKENDTCSEEKVSILGAFSVKEWRVSSPAAGYGFDLIWSSGKLWTYIADTKKESQKWITSFNSIIHFHNETSASSNNSQSVNETVMPFQSPLQTLPLYSLGHESDVPTVVHKHIINHRHAQETLTDTSIPVYDVQNISKDSLHSISSGDKLPLDPPHIKAIQSEPDETSAYIQLDKNELLPKGQQQADVENVRSEQKKDHSRAQEARHQADIQNLRDEFRSRLKDVKEKAVGASEAVEYTRQQSLLRTIEELQSDLRAEKKRSALLEERATNRDKQNGTREGGLRDELNRLTAKFQETQQYMRTLSDEYDASIAKNEAVFDEERMHLEARVAQLEGERAAAVSSRDDFVHSRVKEVSERHSAAQRSLDVDLRASLKRELEAVHMQEMAAIQRRCEADVLAAVDEERTRSKHLLEDMRATYVQRERDTTSDLRRLEELHASRVGKLESQLATSRLEARQAAEEIKRTAMEGSRTAEQDRHRADIEFTALREHVTRADASSAQLLELQRAVHDSRAREQTYREQLSQALEENKTFRFEITELQRQACDGSSQTHQWRKAIQEVELSRVATDTSLRIAKDEIAMLDNELTRLKEENDRLRMTINRADKIIYGTNKPKPSIINKEVFTFNKENQSNSILSRSRCSPSPLKTRSLGKLY